MRQCKLTELLLDRHFNVKFPVSSEAHSKLLSRPIAQRCLNKRFFQRLDNSSGRVSFAQTVALSGIEPRPMLSPPVLPSLWRQRHPAHIRAVRFAIGPQV